jgi:TonB family protein
MLVASVFLHLVFFTILVFLPKPQFSPRKVNPVVSVDLVEILGSKGGHKAPPAAEKPRPDAKKSPEPEKTVPPQPPPKKINQEEAKKLVKELERLAKQTPPTPPKAPEKTDRVKALEELKPKIPPPKPETTVAKPAPKKTEAEPKKEESSADLVKELQKLAEVSPVKPAAPEPVTDMKALEPVLEKFKDLEKHSSRIDIDVRNSSPEVRQFSSKLRSAESTERPGRDDKTGAEGGGSRASSASADKLAAYVGLIRDKVMAHWKSPLGAMNNEVLVSFYVYPGGTIGKPHLQKGSGDDQLDTLAIRAIHESEPLPKFPKELKEPNLYVTIRFKYVLQE